ncbi:MAG TPA: hypothetical protein ENI68_06185 [Gammaproteobacteria bacterium]|nr:hypothetical protein [Gammaproteobacteria bacterium]
MISRRQFLAFLTSCATIFSTQRTAYGNTNEIAAPLKARGLYLHNGWVLRTDDPVDNRTGE